MRGKKFFVAGIALVGTLLNATASFAASVHSYDSEDKQIYGEAVLNQVLETFPEEITNKNPAAIHRSTGDKPLEVTLNAVYGVTRSDDVIGVYYYDDDITLTAAPLDEENEGIVEAESVAKIVDKNLYDADETDYAEGNRSSVIMRRYQEDLTAGTSTLIHDAPYDFLDDFRQVRADIASDEYDVMVVSSTFKITIPAHKKWGFYLWNTSDTPNHIYYTDEEFNEKPAEYANRYYNRTANITVQNKTYTIFGLEDWLVDDRAGTDEQCVDGSAEFQYNCMDANDIVFVIADNYEESEEPEEPEEPEEENPDTGETVVTPMSFALFAAAGIGLIGIRVIRNRNN